MNPKTDEAVQRISELFLRSGAYTEDQVREIAFHLTDWVDDLVPFADFLENPRAVEADQAMDIIVRFLAHAPDHLRIAAERVLNPE